jgi:prepilin-type N-terminal cleavage/methylation domain-containing protein
MKKGFTLIEMAVVLLIIGILAGIVLRNIGGQAAQARDAKRVGDLRILANYLAQYLAKQGQFPTTSANSQNWGPLNTAFQNAGIYVNLPQPPSGAGDVYDYIPCSDTGSAPPTGIANHFVLRARLEQQPSQAPRVYEGNYNSPSQPTGWQCAGTWPTNGCDDAQRYYCLTQ